MADTVRGVDYYYVTVPDAVGEGQRILSVLKDGGVNLVAYLDSLWAAGSRRSILFRRTRSRSKAPPSGPASRSASRSGRF
jgi:hypothetical protein